MPASHPRRTRRALIAGVVATVALLALVAAVLATARHRRARWLRRIDDLEAELRAIERIAPPLPPSWYDGAAPAARPVKLAETLLFASDPTRTSPPVLEEALAYGAVGSELAALDAHTGADVAEGAPGAGPRRLVLPLGDPR
ncbi:MAG: hypothetical protein CMN30_06710 [Sandaracinus sp.]|nr:hypothetical protein [Sandaracinus sp.]|tara:strand:- start:2061 stop:2486 length:426 start_codon:yes stop_codon:yes gene_type:complete